MGALGSTRTALGKTSSSSPANSASRLCQPAEVDYKGPFSSSVPIWTPHRWALPPPTPASGRASAFGTSSSYGEDGGGAAGSSGGVGFPLPFLFCPLFTLFVLSCSLATCSCLGLNARTP